MKINNEQLLDRAKQLDPDAIRALHQQFYEPVARYIRFKVSDPHTVEDLSGEVFVRVLDGLRRGRGWRDTPRGWIMGIARNIVVDYYRKKERMTEVKLSEGLISQEATDPMHQAILNDRQNYLQQAISRLTNEQRDVILLRFMEGLDIRSVAKAINKSPGAIKGLQYRALRTLATIMTDAPVEGVAGVNE